MRACQAVCGYPACFLGSLSSNVEPLWAETDSTRSTNAWNACQPRPPCYKSAHVESGSRSSEAIVHASAKVAAKFRPKMAFGVGSLQMHVAQVPIAATLGASDCGFDCDNIAQGARGLGFNSQSSPWIVPPSRMKASIAPSQMLGHWPTSERCGERG